jgi:hypothetical protein
MIPYLQPDSLLKASPLPRMSCLILLFVAGCHPASDRKREWDIIRTRVWVAAEPIEVSLRDSRCGFDRDGRLRGGSRSSFELRLGKGELRM